jgi:hypothetical protein
VVCLQVPIPLTTRANLFQNPSLTAKRFPQYLREKVQSCLTLCWKFRVPILQKVSPAQLVASTLTRTLLDSVTSYTYVDFCAGAGGPTPYIEIHLNAQLAENAQAVAIPAHLQSNGVDGETSSSGVRPRSPQNPNALPQSLSNGASKDAVQFILTDLHPHIPDWTAASKQSENLSFISSPVDATDAPAHLNRKEGRKIFRLYNLAFHHFDDPLASEILKNTIETADGFG